MPEKKLSLQKCKALINNCDSDLTDNDLENIRDSIYSIANLLFDEYLNSFNNGDDRERN